LFGNSSCAHSLRLAALFEGLLVGVLAVVLVLVVRLLAAGTFDAGVCVGHYAIEPRGGGVAERC